MEESPKKAAYGKVKKEKVMMKFSFVSEKERKSESWGREIHVVRATVNEKLILGEF